MPAPVPVRPMAPAAKRLREAGPSALSTMLDGIIDTSGLAAAYGAKNCKVFTREQ